MNLNWAIRHELRKRKMTETKLAQASGMSINHASVFLHGPAVDMRLSTLETLAEALNLDIKLVRRDETNQNPS